MLVKLSIESLKDIPMKGFSPLTRELFQTFKGQRTPMLNINSYCTEEKKNTHIIQWSEYR